MINRVFVATTIVLASALFAVPAGAQGSLDQGIWIDRAELMSRPMSGSAWTNVLNRANATCSTPDLADQEDPANVCVMAKALVFARTGQSSYRSGVVSALRAIANSGTYSGRALALGRELAAYAISADLIDLKNVDPSLDGQFRRKLTELLTTYTNSGPSSLIACHEQRPNNWGTHCGASRIAVAAYLRDTAQLTRSAQVFRGWLGDRSAYAGFRYGDLSWQCNTSSPVGINPRGCRIGSANVDGVLPDDQRRAGSFSWPPPQENYVWEALQGAMVEAVILKRAGYDPFNWEDKALLRAFQWLHDVSDFPAEGDDTWLPHLANYYYYGEAHFPAPVPSRAGKNAGWTDWTHGGSPSSGSGSGGSTGGDTGSGDGGAEDGGGSAAGTYQMTADSYVRGGTYGSTNYGESEDLDVKDASSEMYDRRVFMKVRVAGTVSSAMLRMRVASLPNGTPVTVCVFAIGTDTWREAEITWNNQPAVGSSLSCQSITSTGWVTWDVTSHVRAEAAGDGRISFMVADTSQANRMVRFDSAETSNPPTLVVN